MYISEIELDALKEIMNIGVGRSASSLNKLVGKRIRLQVPNIRVISYAEVKDEVSRKEKEKLSIITMAFKGELTGLSELVFPTDGAVKIVKILTDDNLSENGLDDELKSNTLSEVGNMILNALIGTIGNLLKTRMRYSIPKYFECKPEEIIDNINPEKSKVIYAETIFKIINEDISGSFIVFLEVDSYKRLLELLKGYSNSYKNTLTHN